MSTMVAYQLYGFPKDVTVQQVEAFLPLWLTTTMSSSSWFQIRCLIPHRRTASAVFLFDNYSKARYKKLTVFLRATRFGEEEDVKRGSVITIVKYKDTDTDTNDNDNSEAAATTTSASTAHPPTFQTATESNNNKNNSKRRNNSNGKKQYDSMATSFLEYIHQEDSQICHRDQVSILFRAFLTSQTNTNNNTPTITKSQLARAEAMVLARMRQRKLLKHKRVEQHTILMTFCDCDSPGSFPSQETQFVTQDFLLEQQLQAQEDKEGVAISRLPDRITASIGGEPTTIAFDLDINSTSSPLFLGLDLDDGGGDTPPSTIVLEDVEIRGAHAHAFELSKWVALLLPMELSSRTTIEWTIHPKRIGILRARAHFVFAEFFIVRPITISCGHAALNRVLQPTAPYQRKPRRFYNRGQKSKQQQLEEEPPIYPPQLTTTTTNNNQPRGANPFATLNQYSIPTETVELIQEHQYETVLKGIGWSPGTTPTTEGDDEEEKEGDDDSVMLDGYGDYWQHLLWASEYQNWMDIQLFDMENAELTESGKYCVLKVGPGLAEGRPSVLRGDLVNVTFQNQLFKGRVHSVKLAEVVLEFDPRFKKKFDQSVDRVQVQFTFSRMTFRTSHRACHDLAETQMGASMLMPLPRHLEEFQRQEADVDVSFTALSPWANRSLNPEQQSAILRIVQASLRPLPYIIFGPPGTGKTTAVVEAVYQLGKKGRKVLLVAPSNDAADILVERLASYFPPSELRRILAYSRGLESLPTTIRSYAKDMLEPQEQLAEIMSARIVVSTVNLAARFTYLGVPRGHFDVLCVDEAGHATEPEVVAVAASLMNFTAGDKKDRGQLVLAGDPKQLGPISTCDLCLKHGLSVSYMERLTNRAVYGRQEDGTFPVDLLTKLVRNYRSHPAIIKLPNEMFYNNDLQCCGDIMVTSNMAKWEHLPKPGFPVVFHALNGDNLREGNSPSWFNPEEAQQVVEYVNLLMKETRPPVRQEDIGIITPYARQAQKIRLALATQDVRNIKVGSVECFQGQERRVILVSTVRAQQEHVSSDLRYNLGFVANPKRFNVAVTRAKTLLIVIGSPSVLAMDKKNWLPFLKYCHENQSWAGEEWDPSEIVDEEDEKDMTPTESATLDDTWDIVDASSQVAEQEGFAFINREE